MADSDVEIVDHARPGTGNLSTITTTTTTGAGARATTPVFAIRRPSNKTVNPSSATTFPPDVVQSLIEKLVTESKEKDAKIKFSSDAVQATAEMLKLFCQEATRKALVLKEESGDTEITPSHLASLLPGLLLDF